MAHGTGNARKSVTSPEPHWAPSPIAWPSAVLVPDRPPVLIYLDLNHWINLAKAVAGKRVAAGYTDLHAAAQRAVDQGRARFVISSSLVVELHGIRDPRQRHDLAAVIEGLTSFSTLASAVDLQRVELLASVATALGDAPLAVEPFPLVRTNILHGFGRRGDLQIVDESGQDRTAETIEAGGPAFRKRWAEAERDAQRMLLVGPEDADLPDLRGRGYRPEIPIQQVIDNKTVEQDFADAKLSDRWRRGRIRDVLAAREISLELWDFLSEELDRRAIDLEAVAGSVSRARTLVLSMPTSCVRVEIKAQYHRNAGKQWTTNDLHDIDAMSVALPYTDIVFTDAAVRDAALRSHLDERFSTSLPRHPNDLTAMLNSLAARDAQERGGPARS